MGFHFYDMVLQFSTVYFIFGQTWDENFNTLPNLSRYDFNIKKSIYFKNMLTKFHEIQEPVTIFFNLM